MQTKKRNIIAILLTVLFLSYYGGISFFQHTHTIGNELVTHSHPYSSSTHGHSAASIVALSLLNNFAITAATAAIALCIYRVLLFIAEIVNDLVCSNTLYNGSPSRAPPAIC